MACATAPHIREPWLSWAEYALDRNDPSSALYACAKALEVTQRTYSYLSDSSCWGVRPYALAAEAARQLGLQQLADEWEAAITPS